MGYRIFWHVKLSDWDIGVKINFVKFRNCLDFQELGVYHQYPNRYVYPNLQYNEG